MSKNSEHPYNPQATEAKIYQTWLDSGFFNPDNLPDSAKGSFVISVPPPNVTGSLHLGHALNAVIQDALIRKKRMEGYKALWIPGTDHAGIATQNVVEKDLKKQGLSRHALGREKFLEKVWEWKEKYGNIILDQFKQMGASMDWSRTHFTMDEPYQKAVAQAFLHYYKKGWLYRAERIINWCVHCQTSLSDLEIEYQEEKTKLYFIKYPLVQNHESRIMNHEYIIVATTRPETMLGDSAVTVNPDDERYKNYIGKKLLLPIQNREIPVIADAEIDIKFGTGAVKVTPAHDFADAHIGEKNNLPIYKIIGPLGRMTDEAGICAGMKITECREKIIALLKQENLIEKIEDYTHNVALCYRCSNVIEPMPSLQWFLKMEELAKLAIKTVDSGSIVFHPKNWEKVYLNWLKNVRDWNISRQIWWGHRLPVFYCSKKQEGNKDTDYIVSAEKPTQCPLCQTCDMRQADDVLDTWFSSALWPFAILGWPEKTKDLAEYYPNHVLSTARDIINLWVARMIYSGMEFIGKPPFKDVIIHATILTKDGKRMSKSLGTGIDPMNLIEKYGADATRFGVIWQNMGTQDIRWSEEHVVAGKKFCNKIWNATRLVLMNTDEFTPAYDTNGKKLTEADKRILQNLASVKKNVDSHIDSYNFGLALHDLYDFFWNEFCAIYLEKAKEQLQNDELKENTKEIMSYALITSLKLMHPFMPFITEEIWSKIPLKNKRLLIVENWPQ